MPEATDCMSADRRGRDGVLNSTRIRQETGERLACPGRRDQQDAAAGARFFQKRQLMRARCPAAAGKPAQEDFGQWHVAHLALPSRLSRE